MTEYAYSRKLVCISEETSMSRMRSVKSSSGGAGGVRAMRLKLLNRWAMSILPVVPVGEMTGAPDQVDHPEPAGQYEDFASAINSASAFPGLERRRTSLSCCSLCRSIPSSTPYVKPF